MAARAGRAARRGSGERRVIRSGLATCPSAPMSAEIERLTVESAARRTGGGGTGPTAVVLAVIALLLAAAAHWRFNRFDDRIDGLRGDLTERSRAAAAIVCADRSRRRAARGVELRPCATSSRGCASCRRSWPSWAAPSRSCARGPRRRNEPGHAPRRCTCSSSRNAASSSSATCRTAIVAMEAADARLSTISDPAIGEVRRLLALELDALRAVPAPDLPDCSRASRPSRQASATLPVQGVPVARGRARRDARRRGLRRVAPVASAGAGIGAISSRCAASIRAPRRSSHGRLNRCAASISSCCCSARAPRRCSRTAWPTRSRCARPASGSITYFDLSAPGGRVDPPGDRLTRGDRHRPAAPAGRRRGARLASHRPGGRRDAMKGAAIAALALVGGGLLAHLLLADPGYVAIRAGRSSLRDDHPGLRC